ncbi:MAG: hypothetical protein U0892_16330 [Pirellulales bacterium]
MIARKLSILALLMALASQSGCAAFQSWLPKKGIPADVVTISPWIEGNVTVPVVKNRTTLQDVLADSKIDSRRTLLSIAVRKIQDPTNIEPFKLEDDCIVLARGNDRWYFLEPFALIEEYAGQVILQPNDRIYTLPLNRCMFVTERHPVPFNYLKIEPGREPRLEPVIPKANNIESIPGLRTASPSAQWTVSILTRLDGTERHHIVFPASFDSRTPMGQLINKSVRVQTVGLSPDLGLFLQPGDIVEDTNLIGFVGRM